MVIVTGVSFERAGCIVSSPPMVQEAIRPLIHSGTSVEAAGILPSIRRKGTLLGLLMTCEVTCGMRSLQNLPAVQTSNALNTILSGIGQWRGSGGVCLIIRYSQAS
jgi:hypothetical protein